MLLMMTAHATVRNDLRKEGLGFKKLVIPKTNVNNW